MYKYAIIFPGIVSWTNDLCSIVKKAGHFFYESNGGQRLEFAILALNDDRI